MMGEWGLAHVVVRRGCRLEKVTARAAAGGHDRIQQPHSRRASLIVRPHRARSITVDALPGLRPLD